MHLFRPATRRLVSIPTHSRPYFSIYRQHLNRRQPFSPLALRLYSTSSSTTEDGLRNNRDLGLDQSQKIHNRDANLLSQLPRAPEGREDVPSYAMLFTCKPCGERSAHRITKQAYHHGTVLITCPACKKRHLMADHLKVQRQTMYNGNEYLELG
jgi:protein import protein ZIM17